MSRKPQPEKPCACGCGEPTTRTWHSGCDRRMEGALIHAMKEAGYPDGLLAIRALVETHLGREVRP